MAAEEVVLLAVLVAITISAAFRARAQARIEAQQQAAFAAAAAANQGLEFTRREIDQLASRSELLFVISCYGAFEATFLDVPWLGNLAAAAAYFMSARGAMGTVQRRASRGAALLLVTLAVAFGAAILLQSPDWPNRRPEWRHAVYVAILALFPSLQALRLTHRHHRLRAGARGSAAGDGA